MEVEEKSPGARMTPRSWPWNTVLRDANGYPREKERAACGNNFVKRKGNWVLYIRTSQNSSQQARDSKSPMQDPIVASHPLINRWRNWSPERKIDLLKVAQQ